MENRYLIAGKVVCHVTFYEKNCVNMQGLCTVRIQYANHSESWDIPISFLKVIAEPAP